MPEVGDADCKVWTVEILCQLKSQNFTNTYSHQWIARKVCINLDSIESACHKARQTCIVLVTRQHCIYVKSYTVGYHHFHKHAPKQHLQPFNSFIIIKVWAQLLQLGYDEWCFVDWARQNARKERYEQCVCEEIMFSFIPFVINIPQVAQSLKSEKRDSDGNSPVQSSQMEV